MTIFYLGGSSVSTLAKPDVLCVLNSHEIRNTKVQSQGLALHSFVAQLRFVLLFLILTVHRVKSYQQLKQSKLFYKKKKKSQALT